MALTPLGRGNGSDYHAEIGAAGTAWYAQGAHDGCLSPLLRFDDSLDGLLQLVIDVPACYLQLRIAQEQTVGFIQQGSGDAVIVQDAALFIEDNSGHRELVDCGRVDVSLRGCSAELGIKLGGALQVWGNQCEQLPFPVAKSCLAAPAGKAQSSQHSSRLDGINAEDAKQVHRLQVVPVVVRGYQGIIRQHVLQSDNTARWQVDEGVQGKKLLPIGGQFPVARIGKIIFRSLIPGIRAQAIEDDAAVTLGWIQVAIYAVPIALITARVLTTRERSLIADAEDLTALSAFIIRAAFWGVFLVGLADAAISFMRIENLLPGVVGVELAKDLGLSNFRGTNVHYPLIGISIIIAIFTRSKSFMWLTLLIVGAEIQIVIARFIFSYEQAFMADLVRFWYGALFLFASAHTLVAEGHVRVDILYTGFSERGKAWTNFLGSAILGIPLCWVILTRGLWGSNNLINGPLLNFEVTQQGYGMYVKYFLAGFLLVYALSMLVQFTSYILSSAAVLIHERGAHMAPSDHAEI